MVLLLAVCQALVITGNSILGTTAALRRVFVVPVAVLRLELRAWPAPAPKFVGLLAGDKHGCRAIGLLACSAPRPAPAASGTTMFLILTWLAAREAC